MAALSPGCSEVRAFVGKEDTEVFDEGSIQPMTRPRPRPFWKTAITYGARR
jgi:hypothetical protein